MPGRSSPGSLDGINSKRKDHPTVVTPEAENDVTDICAKLITKNKKGRQEGQITNGLSVGFGFDGEDEVIVLSINKPASIGRNAACTYVIQDIVVSSLHCKLYAIKSSAGGIIVSCQDLSMNGIILNGRKFRGVSVILMDGDTLQIPSSQTFECVHVWKDAPEKANLFDPTPPRRASHKMIGQYTVTSNCLGTGGFATVHLAIDANTRKQVACKTIKVKKDADLQKVMKEVTILMTLNHPNINRVFDMHVTDKFLHIFLELSTGGDLFTYITTQRNGKLIEGESKYLMYQLLRGMKYLHDKLISHRDLKARDHASLKSRYTDPILSFAIPNFQPENILLYTPGPYPRIQIADFGMARQRAYQETLNVCGTVAYLPPEGVLALDNKRLGYVGLPADCWSAGVILYIMLSGHHPFEWEPDVRDSFADVPSSQPSEFSLRSENTIKSKIVNGEMCFPADIWRPFLEAKDLVGHLLIHNPARRATVYTALRHAWITNDLEELQNAWSERIGGAS